MDITTILLVGLGVFAAVVPIAVRIASKRMTAEQLRLVYDAAHALAKTLEAVAPLTNTTVDDRAAEVIGMLEENLARKLKPNEMTSVRHAVMKAGARAGSLNLADLSLKRTR